jgi:hypothetical protein
MVNNDPKRHRRKNDPGGRSILYQIRLSESEQKALQAKAKEAGITVAALLVTSALKDNHAVEQQILSYEAEALRRQLQQGKWEDELVLALSRKLNP